MVLDEHGRASRIFTNLQNLEQARNELKRAEILKNQIYIVAKDTNLDEYLDEAAMNKSNRHNAEKRNGTAGAIVGSMLGAIGGCLIGIGILGVPGIGLLTAVGTSRTALAATLAGSGIGAVCGSLIEALSVLEIPED